MPQLVLVPVLFLTAKSSVDDRIRGLQAGGDDYMVKPFDPEEHGFMNGHVVNGNGEEDFELEYLQHDNYALVWCVK